MPVVATVRATLSLQAVAVTTPAAQAAVASGCVCGVIDTTCNIYVVVLLGWQSKYLVSPGVSSETYAPLVPPTAAAARNVMSWYFDFSVIFFFFFFFPLLILMKGVLHGG